MVQLCLQTNSDRPSSAVETIPQLTIHCHVVPQLGGGGGGGVREGGREWEEEEEGGEGE